MVSASSLLLPSSVRDFASCIGDGAVRVADVAACTAPSSTRVSTCSSSSSTTASSSSPTLSVTVSYRATLLAAPAPPLQLRLTWGHSPLGPTLSFAPSPTARAIQLRRRRGSRSLPSGSSSGDENGGGGDESGTTTPPPPPPLALFWDLTAARYDPAASSPEPVSGYYVVVAVESAEVVLALGDLAAAAAGTSCG